MKKLVWVIGVVYAIGLLVVAEAVPEGDAKAGLSKAGACASCHEGDGRSAGYKLYPRIAGQHYEYLLAALKEYRSGERKLGYAIQMTDSVKDLSDQDLKDLARYYSELPW